MPRKHVVDDSSPEAIAERERIKEEIQAGWTEDEWIKKGGQNRQPYSIPTVKTNNVGEIRTQRPEKRYSE